MFPLSDGVLPVYSFVWFSLFKGEYRVMFRIPVILYNEIVLLKAETLLFSSPNGIKMKDVPFQCHLVYIGTGHCCSH